MSDVSALNAPDSSKLDVRGMRSVADHRRAALLSRRFHSEPRPFLLNSGDPPTLCLVSRHRHRIMSVI